MKVRIVLKPDFVRSRVTVFSVQKRYVFWPFWIEHGWYPEFELAQKVSKELCDPIIWTGKSV